MDNFESLSNTLPLNTLLRSVSQISTQCSVASRYWNEWEPEARKLKEHKSSDSWDHADTNAIDELWRRRRYIAMAVSIIAALKSTDYVL